MYYSLFPPPYSAYRSYKAHETRRTLGDCALEISRLERTFHSRQNNLRTSNRVRVSWAEVHGSARFWGNTGGQRGRRVINFACDGSTRVDLVLRIFVMRKLRVFRLSGVRTYLFGEICILMVGERNSNDYSDRGNYVGIF